MAGPDLSEFHDLLEEELNVEAIQAEADLDRFQRLVLAPNFRALAPKARQAVNDIANAIKNAEDLKPCSPRSTPAPAPSRAWPSRRGRRSSTHGREGFAAMTLNTQDGDAQVSLVLDMAETPALLSRGLARDITRRVQARRKALD